jgi:hypothetical protein
VSIWLINFDQPQMLFRWILLKAEVPNQFR